MKILQINKPAINLFRAKFCPDGCTIPDEVYGITVCYDNNNKVVDFEMYDSEDTPLHSSTGCRVLGESDKYYGSNDDMHRLFNYCSWEVYYKRVTERSRLPAKVYVINHFEG